MKKIISLLFSIYLMAACTETTDKNGILNKEKMVSILIDIHLAEAQIPNLKFNSQDSARAVFRKFQDIVFEKNQTDSATFYKSYKYYLNNLEGMNEIYVMVVDSLVYRETTNNLGKPIDTTGTNIPDQDELKKKLLKNKEFKKEELEVSNPLLKKKKKEKTK